MIETLSGFADGVVAIRAHGEVTKKDYQDVLIPAIEAALKAHKKIALYYETAADFTGYTLGAMEEDTLLGVMHLLQFRRCVVVSDVNWIRAAIGTFRPLMPCPVRVFPLSHAEGAKHWIETADH